VGIANTPTVLTIPTKSADIIGGDIEESPSFNNASA
jgi:hypothetical protein